MNKTITKLFLSTSVVFSFSLAFNIKFNKEDIKANAEIDINDYSACETAHNSGSASNLLTALRNITSPGKAGSYNDLWTTYTKAYVRDDGKIFDYYSNITNYVPGGSAQGANYSKEGDSYNREHSIPKSWWGGAETNQGADPYIVVPTDGYVNNRRSNYSFGMVSSATYTAANGFGKLGSAVSSWGYNGTVFEPDDSLKGDFARIYFYAIAKYSASYGWTSGEGSVNFSGNANTNYGLTNYAVKLYSYWSNLDPVSDWERSVNDKVAAIQKNRNPFIDHPEYANTLWGSNSNYTQYTHTSTGITSISKTEVSLSPNGTTTISATSSNSGTISWSSSNTNVVTVSSATAASGANVTLTAKNTTGSATITASITISGQTYSKTCSVTVSNKTLSSISVSGQKTSFTVDDTFSFGGTVTATFSDSTTDNVTASATFTGYDMSEAGSQTVTVSYTYGNTTKTTTYEITVSASGGGDPSGGEGELITSDISFTGSKSQDTDSKGIVWSVNGSYTVGSGYLRLNSSSTYISNQTALKVYTQNTINVQAVLRTYGGVSSQSLRVTAYNSSGTAISNTLVLSPTGTTLTAYSGTLTFTTNEYTNVTIKAYSGNNNSLGISGMTIKYTELDESGGSDPETPTLSSITLNTDNVTKAFVVNGTFSYSGLVVTAHYSDSTSATVTPTNVFSPDMSSTGNKTVAVSYTEGGVTKSATYTITVSAAPITSITASVSKTYYVGETISSSDITVKDNNNNTIEGFTFANDGYQFTYSDAASGGDLTNKTFSNSITYSNLTCSLTAQVQRKARQDVSDSVSDTITASMLTATGTTYTSFSNVSATSTARYAGKSAKDSRGNIQLRVKDSDCGIVSTVSGGSITSVTINVGSGSNQIEVYGKNTAYTSASNLFSDGTKGTLVGSRSTSGTITFTTGYAYIGIKSGNGAVYISSIVINYGASDSAVNLANYIMYEDTNNQCTSKLNTAIGYLGDLSSDEKSSFQTSNDYVISTARERLEAWARHQGKTINYSTGVLQGSTIINNVIDKDNLATIITVVTISSICGVVLYFYLRHKFKSKEE